MTNIVSSVKKTLSIRRKNKDAKAGEATRTEPDEHNDHADIDEENIDQYSDAEEEVIGHLHKSVVDGESTDKIPHGTMLHRLIFIGNKKTEDQIRKEHEAHHQQQQHTVVS